MNDSNAHIYIMAFTRQYGLEPIDKEVKWWLESQLCSNIHSRSCFTCWQWEEKVRRGQHALELFADVDQVPLVEQGVLDMEFTFN